ncbi:MAG: hypothetical protein A2117_01340 [Candidatus Wildermuthbacteria bacterium GWA2_46_15]|uniref:DNA 3'-5' helicase n=1 Tax=Candidatus Wildermuthbacteria bacterium GWA2_46_15 TaxID=1802443 RepID=A0A1G2QS65_9BACT|nr:MAG: hypothetical protein A2117_01340 [Candidatus Wildermuthbacteria bacterium GWA2_46_15]
MQNILFLDLETNQTGKIFKIGAVIGEKTFFCSGKFNQAEALRQLDAFAAGAQFVSGHNILKHDLGMIKQSFPEAKILRLPIIDTLLLSPLCFPANPYHHLIKDYKLVPAAMNDPVSDCKQAQKLLIDEISKLRELASTSPELYAVLKELICNPKEESLLSKGMHAVLDEAAPTVKLPKDIIESIQSILGEFSCKTAAKKVAYANIATENSRWLMAYSVRLLSISRTDSVLQPWVRLHYPTITSFLSELRDVPCSDPLCSYCTKAHNSGEQLKQYFGFDKFRDEPKHTNGNSLQLEIVNAGMRGESLLAIMPTGGGKSLGFQLPALVRNARRGYLTVVISPLQALMKDQVDSLQRQGLHNCAALCGILTLPERADVLKSIRSGSIALLYLSPEQLRSRAVYKALLSREIGCWVVDEAHCLSKWGHDFRPDYLYSGRVIKKIAMEQNCPVPPIACFTATAKKDVIEDVQAYFKNETGTEMSLFEGGVERTNLKFEVQMVPAMIKLPRINDLLGERLGKDAKAYAVVFRAKRADTEDTARFLSKQGWRARHFHAGLTVSEKKEVQDLFLAGDIQVICATNAFGMGVDKQDIRLVIHGDTPASLENYLQEAGRAGRDQEEADCILLYNEEDCEQQFRLSALSELSRRDIAQILRGLRKAAIQRHTDEIVITTGELLRDEDVEVNFQAGDANADTKVRTAIAWLEREGFLERNENLTNVLQAKPLVNSIQEAKIKLKSLGISEGESRLWLAILQYIFSTPANDSIRIDDLAGLPEFAAYAKISKDDFPQEFVRDRGGCEYLSSKVFKTLDAMVGAGVLQKSTLLSAYLRYKIEDSSIKRAERIAVLNREIVKTLGEYDPDPNGYVPLDLKKLNQELRNRDFDCSLPLLRQLMKSFKADSHIFNAHEGEITLRSTGRDIYRVKITGGWGKVTENINNKLRVAEVVLAKLLACAPEKAQAARDLLVEFTYEDLVQVAQKDPDLKQAVKDWNAAIEQALLFLHEQQVIVLQKGLSIFRTAMTIKVLPEGQGKQYSAENYERVHHHYKERVFQVHVMNEYANLGISRIQDALHLVLAYFIMSKESFVAKFFAKQKALLEMATTANSYDKIVEKLENRAQEQIVTAPTTKPMLILAGPGSGKTRAVVHRCAYLLRIKRVKAQSILICCFTHKAAIEIRRRLTDLVGADARGVTVQTYHALALRILGLSVADMMEEARKAENFFENMISDVVEVLNGTKTVAGLEADEVRDRLLAGFEHILVDEYQDIDEKQYAMISAIAGRKLKDSESDRKLSILAVGDDDQGIYGFRGSNVKFIKQFQIDYGADVKELIENYRSSGNIIDASNTLIEHNKDRMKKDRPIRINKFRSMQSPGGQFGDIDALTKGKVSVVKVNDILGQAEAAIKEAVRLKSLGIERWDSIAILARNHVDLSYIRSRAEALSVPVSWPIDGKKMPPLHRIREIRRALDTLSIDENLIANADEFAAMLGLEQKQPDGNIWFRLLSDLLDDWRAETQNEKTPVKLFVDFIYESLHQLRKDESVGEGVVLSTVHAAKGKEFPHVLLCGDWGYDINRDTPIEEQRRVFYVGMTRAQNSLAIFDRQDTKNIFSPELKGECFIYRAETSAIDGDTPRRDYSLLGLGDLFIDYAGRLEPGGPFHGALANLKTGDKLTAIQSGDKVGLIDSNKVQVALLSKLVSAQWMPQLEYIESIRVLGMVQRYKTDSDKPEFTEKLQVDQWEVPFCEIVTRLQK